MGEDNGDGVLANAAEVLDFVGDRRPSGLFDQFHGDEVFPEREGDLAGVGEGEEVAQESGIDECEAAGFGSFSSVGGGPGGDGARKKDAFEEGEVAGEGGGGQSGVAREGRDIGDFVGIASKGAEESGEGEEAFDVGELADVSLDESFEIVFEPSGAAGGGGPGDWFGISAGEEGGGDFGGIGFGGVGEGVRSLERPGGEIFSFLFGLALGKGPEGDDFHAAGKGVGEFGKSEDVGAAGEDEASGETVGVDFGLDGAGELGGALDFVDDEAVGMGFEEGGGGSEGGVEGEVVVEGDVGEIADLADEGGFSALAGALDDDDGGVGEGFGEVGGEVSGEEAFHGGARLPWGLFAVGWGIWWTQGTNPMSPRLWCLLGGGWWGLVATGSGLSPTLPTLVSFGCLGHCAGQEPAV